MSKASKNHILLSAVSFVIRKEPQSSIVDNCAMFKLLSCKKIFSPIDTIDLLENKYEDHRSTNRVSKLNMINSRRKDKIFPLPAVSIFFCSSQIVPSARQVEHPQHLAGDDLQKVDEIGKAKKGEEE
ncbi:hypothetical protein T4B_7867 [Trichinella pseudospiralis]|uniref:Uncharacterized protein n=1 Tax=Trichinella pseudospiralis TaxID=6337 RepID=A0A0V1JSZ4_TRIPS|nr:hypothetical protein T4B_7867 [Trichinella pseudospiralis]KRZ38099.1 hypothetical protein T4C_6357 [Trichinella pseudospiralis]